MSTRKLIDVDQVPMLTRLMAAPRAERRWHRLVVGAALLATAVVAVNTHLIPVQLLASLLLVAAAVGWLLWLRRPALRDGVGADPPFADALPGVASEGDLQGETLFIATPVATILVDCESLAIVAANPAAAALYGHAPDTLTGQSFGCLQEASPAADTLAGKAPCSGLARHRRADGSTIWVEITIQSVRPHRRNAWLVAIVDVSASHRLANELETAERNYRELVELSLGIIFIHDLAGNLLMANPAFARSLGHDTTDLTGRSLADFVVPRQHDAFSDYLLNAIRNGQDPCAVHMLGHDRSERVWEFRSQVRAGASGSQEVLCTAIDITERRRKEQRLLESQRKDPLTGCYNRRHLDVFQADAEPGASWACIVIDIDALKRYNDAHGHAAGDQAIVRMARFLERMVRKDDSIVRLGGDEFVILMRHCDQSTLESFALRLQAACATHETIPFSFGFAMRKKDEDLEQTIHRADQQMIERRVIEHSSIRLDEKPLARRPERRQPFLRVK